MSLELSKNILSINQSATMAMVDKIAVLRKEGKEIISFNVGEPDYQTPAHINNAIIDAINTGKTKYASASGINELKVAIVDKLKKDNNLDYNTNQIVVTTGAKQALFETIMSIINEGDEIIIPTPCWVSYEEMVKACNGKCVFVKTKEDDFQLDLDAIEKAITSKTKAIIINTPNNPTGSVYTKESLVKLAKLACDNKFFVIADEIYEKLIYDGKKHFSIASINQEIYKQTITINGFAKAYAMTGLRLGYLATTKELASIITNLQTHLTSNVTTPVQYGGVVALTQHQEVLEAMIEQFAARKELAMNLLDKIPLLKYNKVHGAFYIMVDVSAYFNKRYKDYLIRNADDLVMYLLMEAQVALVSGVSFQAPNHLRLSYSNSQENIEKGLNKMKEALEKLSEE